MKGLVYTTLEGAGAGDDTPDNTDLTVEGARPLTGATVVVTDTAGTTTSATLANIPARKSYRVTTHKYIIGNILRALEQPKVGLDNDQTKLNVTFGHLVTTHLHWVFHLIRSKWPHWFGIF